MKLQSHVPQPTSASTNVLWYFPWYIERKPQRTFWFVFCDNYLPILKNCPGTFSTKGILHKHNRIKHIKHDKLKCPHCEWSFSERGAIWTHTSHKSMKMRSFTAIAVRRRSVFLAKRSIWDCTRNRTNRRYSFVQMNKRKKCEQCLHITALQKTLRSHIRVQHDGLR